MVASTRAGGRTPRWALLCAVLGTLLVLGSGSMLVLTELAVSRVSGAIREGNLFGGAEEDPNYGEDITGPLNILLAGLDTRPSRPDETPRADAIIVVHINQTLNRGYMISVPRDALVDIPAEPATGYLGGRDRINSAMFHGADPAPGEDRPNVERGFALLAQTVSDLTGVERFDAGVVLRFGGFVEIVDAMDGVSIELRERIVSEHRQPDGRHRAIGCGSYCGPQMVYEPGSPPCRPAAPEGAPFRCDLNGWQALDVVRQRYGVEGGDYGRQENQQRVLEAMMGKAVSRDMITNPLALNQLLQAVGDAMIFDGRGREVIDFAFALRDLRPSSLVMIGLPGDSVGVGTGYQGEELRPEALELFAALRQGQVDQFILEHSDLVDG
jgi:anionic cell wall polymer biosynthesis LytR-Cps2A-Psr (LCP) family protein